MIRKYLKDIKGDILKDLFLRSLWQVVAQQGWDGLVKDLEQIVPDISQQYTRVTVEDKLTTFKMRVMHAFQISLVLPLLKEMEDITIVDIGDSSGTHMQYLKALNTAKGSFRCLSVNLDVEAVNKIRKKGLEAICCRAEHLQQHQIDADIFVCYETLEHLMDPCHFLHSLSIGTTVKYFILTVPFKRVSRVALDFSEQGPKYAEGVHVFEFSPEDWRKIFQFSGWRIENEQIYFQYPRNHWLSVTAPYWRKYDYEGFYGVCLTRDDTWSHLYQDW